ncbi:MAG TPA: hypothetical protein DDX91_00625 [Ruminococcaceae bacterium]|nr:hypothetical protein [Oscillospiraceae bacterium]
MKLKTVFKIMIITSILIPVIIVGIVGTFTYNSSFGQMVSDETGAAAYNMAKTQSLFFDKYDVKLSLLAHTDYIKRTAGGDYNAIKEQVDSLTNELISDDDALIDISVMDSNGYIVASNNEGVLKDTYKDLEELQKTPDDGIYISNITDEKYLEDVIYIIKPLTASNDSKGYVAAVVSAGKLNASLSDAAFYDSKSTVLFMDGNGNALNVDGQIKRKGEWTPVTSISADSLSGLSDNNKFASFTDSGYYGAYGKIGSSNWIWIGAYPIKSANFNVVPVTIVGLIIFAMFIVADSLIAFAIYRRAITPIGKVITAMDEINAGDRSKRLPNFKAFEYQIIAEYFNALLDDFYISEDIHKTIASLSESMLFEWDIEKKSLYVSDNFRDRFDIDYENADLEKGGFLDALMSEVDSRHFLKDMESLLKGTREYVENEFLVKTRSNSEIWINVKTSAILNRMGDITKLMGVAVDINNKKKSSIQLSQKASYDFLSQLYNRSTFLKELQKLLDLKRVNERYAVLFVDVDDFKFINDRYGHNVGDEVIKYVSDTLKECVGDGGIAGRFGGDEFVLCVTDPAKVNVCDEFAMSIIDSLYSGYNCETAGVILNINASVGISFVPDHGNDAEKLVGCADEAMYFVKKNGKSNYHIYDPEGAPNLDLGNTLT